jgi:hypothetical protein
MKLFFWGFLSLRRLHTKLYSIAIWVMLPSVRCYFKFTSSCHKSAWGYLMVASLTGLSGLRNTLCPPCWPPAALHLFDFWFVFLLFNFWFIIFYCRLRFAPILITPEFILDLSHLFFYRGLPVCMIVWCSCWPPTAQRIYPIHQKSLNFQQKR